MTNPPTSNTMVPTGRTLTAEEVAHWSAIAVGAKGHDLIASANTICRFAATVQSLSRRLEEARKERDEADRRAGAAERELADANDSIGKRKRWLRDAKRDAGYHDNTSFDVVWVDALAALKASKSGGTDAS